MCGQQAGSSEDHAPEPDQCRQDPDGNHYEGASIDDSVYAFIYLDEHGAELHEHGQYYQCDADHQRYGPWHGHGMLLSDVLTGASRLTSSAIRNPKAFA